MERCARKERAKSVTKETTDAEIEGRFRGEYGVGMIARRVWTMRKREKLHFA